MKRIILFFILAIGFCSPSKAQLETAVWYFGDNAGLDFNTPEPKILLDGALSNLEGVASFSDSLGRLLFYTDGRTVWNRQHKVMSNGAQLVGHVSSTESAIIVPWPGNSSKYLLFVVDAEFGSHGLSYSVVDMTLDGGLGGITAEKNIVLENAVCEKVTAIRHANNRDFWILARPAPGTQLVEYLVDENGIQISSRSTFDACSLNIEKNSTFYNPETGHYDYAFDPTMSIGYMRIAPSGRKIAVANASASLMIEETGQYVNILEVLDFDPATGEIKPFVTYLDTEAFLYGVEFSNDVSKLYFTSRRKIFQMDLALGSPQEVANSVTLVGEYPMLTNIDTSYAGALQLALNGKIYVAQRDYGYLGVISSPREKGAACNYVVDGQYLGGRKSLMGLPNFVPTYFLPPKFNIKSSCANQPTTFECADNREIDSYQWSVQEIGGQVLATANTRSFSHWIKEPGKYRASLTVTSKGVEHSDYRIFEVYSPPALSLIPDTMICRGGYADLMPERNDSCSFEWIGRSEPIVRALGPMSIVGRLQDLNTGCVSLDTVNVSVAEPAYFSLGGSISYCHGSQAVVSPQISKSQYLEWEWSDTRDTMPQRVFSSPGRYPARALDTNFCQVSDTIEVIENPLPNIDLGSDTILCSNIPRTLNCGVPGASYIWSTGDTSQAISPHSGGRFEVKVTDKRGCSSTQSITLTSKTLPEVTLPADTVMCDGNDIELAVHWPDAISYLWEDFSNLPSRTVSAPGTYRVEVENACGSASDEVDIRYRYCGEFVFPNIITPNGDGINDFFKIKGLDEYVDGWSIDIYSREGNKVYHSGNYHNEWCAPDVSDGVYFYVFYRGGSSYNGNITVFHR